MADEKLKIPGPEPTDEDPAELDMVLVTSWAVAMIICMVGFFFLYDAPAASSGSIFGGPPPEEAFEFDKTLKKVESSENPTEAASALNRDLVIGSFRYGPRRLNEYICRAKSQKVQKGTVDSATLRALQGRLDEEPIEVPWNCLLKLYFADNLQQLDDLRKSVESGWAKISSFEAESKLIDSVVKLEVASPGLIEYEPFRHFVQWCGLNFELVTSEQCQQILEVRAPEGGMDILGTLEKRLLDSGLKSSWQVEIAAKAAGHLAANGQPEAWKVDSTMFLGDYDRALTIGAAFQLCRFAHSPESEVSNRAVEQLGQLAEIENRHTNKQATRRWAGACQKLFYAKKLSGQRSSQALAVATGPDDKDPKYTFDSLMDRGLCSLKLGYPVWFCALQYWQGSQDQKLGFQFQDRWVDSG